MHRMFLTCPYQHNESIKNHRKEKNKLYQPYLDE